MQSVISSSTPTIPINADLTHASESAVDPLWKYQLRREHKALFEKMEAHFTKYKEEKEANLASLKQVQDQVTAVENKIEQWTTKVEAQMDKLGSDNQELREDLRNFRTVLIQPVQQQNENESPSRIHEAAVTHPKALPPIPAQSVIQAAPPIQPQDPERLSAELTRYPLRTIAPPVNAWTSCPSGKDSQKGANIGIRKSKKRKAPVPSNTSIPMTPRSLPAQHTQGETDIEDYFKTSVSIARELSPEQEKDFVVIVVAGLREKKDKLALIEELEKTDNSTFDRVLGHVKFHCGWEDLMVAMQTVFGTYLGSLGDENMNEDETELIGMPAKKKRKLRGSA